MKSSLKSRVVLLALSLSAAAFPAWSEPLVPLEPVLTVPAPPAPPGFSRPAVALRPDGGFVAVYRDIADGAVLGRWFGPVAPDGTSETGFFDVETRPSNSHLGRPGLRHLDQPVVVRGADGAFLAVWVHDELGLPALLGRLFDGQGTVLSETHALAPGAISDFAVAALPEGGFALVWAEYVEGETDGDVRVRFLGPDGATVGSPVGVAESVPFTLVGAAASADGTLAVTWSPRDEGTDTSRLLGRAVSADGAPLGDGFEIVAPQEAWLGHDVSASEAGSFLVAWTGSTEAEGRIPRAVRARSFTAAGSLGPVHRLDVVGESDAAAFFPAVAAGPEGGVVAWSEGYPGSLTQAVRVGPDGSLRSEPWELHSPSDEGDGINGLDVDRDASGRAVFGWGTTKDSPILPPDSHFVWTTVARRFAEPGDEEPPPPAEPPPPPDAPPLTSGALPGFRTWVVITAPGGESVLGTKEEACIPETLCVSGRVPGRSEVFVRIVGPKPNGRLWPTLVKFSTSRVEVWIEQIGTGEIEYYRLEGAAPGIDELPGLFDREGFEP